MRSRLKLGPNAIALLLLTLALGLSLLLTILHFSNYSGGESSARFCSPSSGCTSALNSRFSTVFGLPVALLASFYLLAWIHFWHQRDRFLLPLTSIGGIVSVFYLCIIFFHRTLACRYCLMFHATHLTMIVFAFKHQAALTRPLLSKQALRRGSWVLLGMIVLFFTSKLMTQEWLSRAENSGMAEELLTAPERPDAFLALGAHFGTTSKPEDNLIFFLDPGCDHCKAHLNAFEAYQNLAGKKEFTIIPFPRESKCAPAGTNAVPQTGACAVIALLDCLPKEHRMEFYQLLAQDHFWKLVSPDTVKDAFASFFGSKALEIKTCNTTHYRPEFARLLQLEEEELNSGTPITYIRGQWYLGAFKVSDFARLNRAE